MNFLEWLGFNKMVKDGAEVLEFPKPKLVEPVQTPYLAPKPPAPPKAQEHYRVGYDTENRTTLTFLGQDGASMTLSMNQVACEQLIRMLRATYQDEVDPEPTDDPDGGEPVPVPEQKAA